MTVVDLADLKSALGIDSSLSGDDYDLVSKLLAAEAAYVRWVGPLPGVYTRTLRLPTLLPRGVTAVTVPGVTTTFSAGSGLLDGLYWYGPIEVTYTVGPLADDHLEAILADVAEYWDRSQRDVAMVRPGFDEGGPGGFASARPVTLFPRIMALASQFA